jgi:hypothetical protein
LSCETKYDVALVSRRIARGAEINYFYPATWFAGGLAMKDEFQPAIAALQSDLQEIEKKAAETKRAINRLCELAGAPPMYSVTDMESSRPGVTTLRNDQFYGKVMNTAAREYLEMRKAANLGPATPREI